MKIDVDFHAILRQVNYWGGSSADNLLQYSPRTMALIIMLKKLEQYLIGRTLIIPFKITKGGVTKYYEVVARGGYLLDKRILTEYKQTKRRIRSPLVESPTINYLLAAKAKQEMFQYWKNKPFGDKVLVYNEMNSAAKKGEKEREKGQAMRKMFYREARLEKDMIYDKVGKCWVEDTVGLVLKEGKWVKKKEKKKKEKKK